MILYRFRNAARHRHIDTGIACHDSGRVRTSVYFKEIYMSDDIYPDIYFFGAEGAENFEIFEIYISNDIYFRDFGGFWRRRRQKKRYLIYISSRAEGARNFLEIYISNDIYF